MPPLDAVLAFSAIVTLIVLSPGPNLFLLLRNTLLFGRSAGLGNVVGIAVAILSHAVLSLGGVGAIIAHSAFAFSVLKVLGAIYLVWLGLKAFRAAQAGPPQSGPETGATRSGPQAADSVRRSLGKRVVEGWATNILNPKPALFYLAAFPQFVALDGAPVAIQGMVLGGLHATIALLWYGAVVFGVQRAVRTLRRPRVWSVVQSLTGAALTALGGRLLLERAPG